VGLFDAIREKAGELLSGATEKVGDLTADLPGVQEVQDMTQSAGDQATAAAENLSGTATDATDTIAGALPEMPPEAYRP
jgi:uncharacterized protein YunC (DUF1805 family)